MGLGEIGDIVSCNRDGAFCKGYDPRIALTRTQTIMSGASHCDFRYRSGPSAAGLTARESGLPELEERGRFPAKPEVIRGNVGRNTARDDYRALSRP
jgi:hypothetical protein